MKRTFLNQKLKGLKEILPNWKKIYYDYDDTEYRGIRNIRDLFDLSMDEDYYEPIIARVAFNSSYIQYKSMGDKGKNLSIKEYLI